MPFREICRNPARKETEICCWKLVQNENMIHELSDLIKARLWFNSWNRWSQNLMSSQTSCNPSCEETLPWSVHYDKYCTKCFRITEDGFWRQLMGLYDIFPCEATFMKDALFGMIVCIAAIMAFGVDRLVVLAKFNELNDTILRSMSRAKKIKFVRTAPKAVIEGSFFRELKVGAFSDFLNLGEKSMSKSELDCKNEWINWL